MALKHKRQGFTLVELMIAVIAGSFAVAGVYYLSGVSARMFGEQMRVSETQLSLRSAMEQLRRDIARAGYLAAPNSTLLPDCGGTLGTIGTTGVAPRAIRALSVTHNGSVSASTTVRDLLGLNPLVNQTRADRLDLWGNYATSDAYLVDPTASTSTSIVFQTGSESFRRSFFTPAAGNGAAIYDATATGRFALTFAAGRMLRIEQDGRFFFRDIQSVNPVATGPSVQLTAALPPCFDPSRWTAAAPVMRVSYMVEGDNETDLARVSPATAGVGSRRTLLVRRERTDSTDARVAQSSRVVLDYAVEFAVDAIVDTSLGGTTPAWQYTTGSDVTTSWDATPHAYRALVVTLTSRSSDADPNLPAMGRARFAQAGLLDSPLMTFRVFDPARTGVVLNARVRTLRSEIFLQNL